VIDQNDNIAPISEQIKNKIDAFKKKWQGSDYGPAHILLSDYNVDDGSLLFCLNEIHLILTRSRNQTYDWPRSELTKTELAETADLIFEIYAIPEHLRRQAEEEKQDYQLVGKQEDIDRFLQLAQGKIQ